MAEKLIHIKPDLENWLKEILLSDRSTFFILYLLKDREIDFETIELKFYSDTRRRSSPIKRDLGFLIFKSNQNSEIEREFLSVIFEALEHNSYSIHGLVNYFILIDRLGSLHDEFQHNMTLEVLKKLSGGQLKQIIEILIDQFNKEYHFSQHKTKKALTCEEWDELFFTLQYVERFNNPIDLLRRIINYSNNAIDLVESIGKLYPDPRVALCEYGLNFNSISENRVLEFLRRTPEEITFCAALILDEFQVKPSFAGEKLISFLIKDNWETSGKYYFLKAVSKPRTQINESTKDAITRVIDQYLRAQFSSIDSKYEVFQNFSWPDDYLALGGWLLYIHKDDEPDFDFNQEFQNKLTLCFTNTLSEIIETIPLCFSDSMQSYRIWFTDLFDDRVQYAQGYMQWSILHCSQETFEEYHKQFKNLCYSIKELYYGSYTANRLAQKLTNNLLGLTLAYPTIQPDNIDRERKLLNTFTEIILYPWVIYTEREDQVSNPERKPSGHSEVELYNVLERLRKPHELYNEVVSEFKNKISENSTITWPI